MRFIKKLTQNKELLIVIVLALIVRLIGINHGYPYIFHIDEPAVVRSVMGIRFSPIIDHFDWPHFGFYFNYIFYFIFIKFRGGLQLLELRQHLEPILPILWNDPFIFYLISRCISAILGAFTIIPIYLLMKNLNFSKRAMIIGGLFFAFIPYHVSLSHFTMSDISLLFWIMWGVYFLHKGVFNKSFKNYIFSGIFFGIAIGVKYNAAFMLSLLPLFILEIMVKDIKNLKVIFDEKFYQNQFRIIKWHIIPSIATLIITSIVFLLTTFSLYFKWDIFWSHEYGRGVLWQFTSNIKPLPLNMYWASLYENIISFWINFGYAGILLFLVGSVLLLFNLKFYGIKKIPKGLISFFIVSVCYFLYVSKFNRHPSHYFLPIYGFITILSTYAIDFIYQKKKFLFSMVPILIIAVMISKSVYINYKLLNKDTRQIAFGYYELTKSAGYSFTTYYNGENLEIANGINNMGLKKLKDVNDLRLGDIMISINRLDDDVNIELIDTIENKGREGPVLYIYIKR